MKIGQFAAENHISIDTVRYYMELGLIIPHKKGGQYEFDHICTRDMEEILKLKELGFSLQEIKTFFYYRQFVKVENKISSKYYRAFFQRKIEDTQKTIESLTRNLKVLEDRLAVYDAKESRTMPKRGIELGSLSILCCPGCGGDLLLQRGTIEDNQVVEGFVVCGCGGRYEINDGILILGKAAEHENTDVSGNIYKEADMLFEYIDSTNSIFLDITYQSLNWYDYKTKKEDFTGKVVLELGTGAGSFLRTVYDKLGDDTLYIAIDNDINVLRLIKSIIESSDSKRNIMYICADFKQLPIKEGSVDILVDWAGSTNYNFEHNDFLLEGITRYLKDNSILYGGYILFDKFGRHNTMKLEYRKNFALESVKKALDRLNLTLVDELYSPKYYCRETYKYESYQQLGDVIFMYLCTRRFQKP